MHIKAPKNIWRSKGSLDHLVPNGSVPPASTQRVRRLDSVWLCLFPVVMASLGVAETLLEALN
jgi:hypothetical protein